MNAQHPIRSSPNGPQSPSITLAGGVTAIVALLLAGCNSANLGVSIQGKGDGALATAVGTVSSSYVLLDLSNGSLSSQVAIPDLTTNSAYTSSTMVFKRVSGLGNDFLLGVFEVTQAQWSIIAPVQSGGVPPWDPTKVDPSFVGGSGAISGPKPAFDLSYTAIATALASYNAGKTFTLAVPTSAQWTYACAAGSTGLWSWGNDSSNATVSANAVVWETQGDTASSQGPQAVGGRLANAFGFYDMHGNVWEWTSPGTTIQGGS